MNSYDAHRHWLLVEHDRIDNQAHSVNLENAKIGQDFLQSLDWRLEGYRRSAGQIARWRKFHRLQQKLK